MALTPQQNNDQALTDAFTQAPLIVQAFIRNGKFQKFSDELAIYFGASVEKANAAAYEFLFVLLGMTEPQALLTNLVQEAKLSSKEAGDVLDLARTQIFAPLEAAASTEKPETEIVPVLADLPPGKAPVSVMQKQPASKSTAQPTVASVAKPLMPPITRPQPITAAQISVRPGAPAPRPISPVRTEPPARTMQSDIEAMRGGKTPEPFVRTAPAPLQGSNASVRPSTPQVSIPPLAKPAPAPQKTPNVAELSEGLKKYGVDPYREPVE